MGARVVIIGVGDVGGRFARLLAATGEVGELTLAGLCRGEGPFIAATLSSCHEVIARFIELDATRQADVETLIRDAQPDLIVQSGSLISPFTLFTRTDPVARTIVDAGLGVQLSAQLPILTSVMRAVRGVGYAGPVANISFPDVTHPILERLDLSPTIGLGNATIILARARRALRERTVASGAAAEDMPLVRLVGHHNHVYGAVLAKPPESPDDRVRVYLGEEGERADDLPYGGYPLRTDWSLNEITTCSSLPVLRALLPGAAPLRISCPGPLGLPGGLPVRIADGSVALDLPDGVEVDEAVAYLERFMRRDGVAGIAADGTVTYTEAAQEAVRELDPVLAEPLHPDDAQERFRRLAAVINR